MLREVAITARNLLTGGNLKAFTMKPRAALNYVNECLFLNRVLNPKGDLPQKLPSEVFGVKDFLITMRPEAAVSWFTSYASLQADFIALMTITRLVKPKRIFEIGTLSGAASLHFALNSEAEIFTLNLPPNATPALQITEHDKRYLLVWTKLVFEGTPEAKRIHCLYGDSSTFDFSPYRNNIDLFFIDGAHSYAYVCNDTYKALFCCDSGSVICWHDYGRCAMNGVSKFLHEFRSGREIYRTPGGSLAYMRV